MFQIRIGKTQFRVGRKTYAVEEFLELASRGKLTPTQLGKALEIDKFKPSRYEVIVERQSPRAREQAVAETVSNSIDAILQKTDADKPPIGQWGEGIKMLVNLLETPEDRIVVTNSKDGITTYAINLADWFITIN